MALEDTIVLPNQVDDGGHVIVDGDEGEVIRVLAREVIDLEMLI